MSKRAEKECDEMRSREKEIIEAIKVMGVFRTNYTNDEVSRVVTNLIIEHDNNIDICGKWIKIVSLNYSQAIIYDYKCSNCSHHRNRPMPYCEICGAKMEGSEDK